MLFNNNNQVFIARRNDVGKQSWQFPQGGINSGEEPEAAALRELEEETNIKSVRIVDRTAEWLYYDYPPNVSARSFCRELSWTKTNLVCYALLWKRRRNRFRRVECRI